MNVHEAKPSKRYHCERNFEVIATVQASVAANDNMPILRYSQELDLFTMIPWGILLSDLELNPCKMVLSQELKSNDYSLRFMVWWHHRTTLLQKEWKMKEERYRSMLADFFAQNLVIGLIMWKVQSVVNFEKCHVK